MGNDQGAKQFAVLNSYILQNPKNVRRKRNKIIVENDCFELLFDTHGNEFKLAKKDELFFSIIPYDTSRKYIEMAVFIFLNNPEDLDVYLEKHQNNVIKYVSLSLFQVTGQKFSERSVEVGKELEKLKTDHYFKIQVAGRLLQHDETGPLSATLPYKFLYDFNIKTGIHGYIDELIYFYKSSLRNLPLALENKSLYIKEDCSTSPKEIKDLGNHMSLSGAVTRKLRKSQLSSEKLLEISLIRKNYKAQSQQPALLEKYFDNVHDSVTDNRINVVSDIHSTKSTIDLVSPHFNIIAGDLSDAFAENTDLKGIAVIGNHDIVECGLAIDGLLPPKLMKSLRETTDTDYSSIKIDDLTLYDDCKKHLEMRFTGLTFLNNQSYKHNGIRYIGLSVPICYVKKRKQVQEYLANVLEQLLAGDKNTPTIVISHAPLFNELSMLSPKSSHYKKKFECVNAKLKGLFRDYSILGVIHGHHHIPASSGVIDVRQFSGKQLFVVCSIYSYLNKGLDLQAVLDDVLTTSRSGIANEKTLLH